MGSDKWEVFLGHSVQCDACGFSALGCGDDGYQERKKFCWILFIYTKCMLADHLLLS